ncbi:MAG: AAA family ATPase, partial [Candidatus Coatesbacteria bacterium]|nr:AAA family ATPase [Candidatus Coatesbacteria bacterium]
MRCVHCGTELPEGAKFCFECGAKQTPQSQLIFSDAEIADIRAQFETDEYASRLRDLAREGLSIERREIAVMFLDVSGFTRMSTLLSREQLRGIMHDVYSVMTEGITKFGGYIDKFLGDEVMALFGAPIALEHPCDRAITVASEIAIGMGGVNHRFKDELPHPLSIHAGIAFGEVEAGRFGISSKLEYTVLGEAVNLAKRLTDAAPSGSVFVCERTKSRTSDRFEFESLGELRLEGIETPVRPFRALGPKVALTERPRFGHLDAPMVARDAELDELKSALDDLIRCYPSPVPCAPGGRMYEDASHIIGIVGEAGIGKSRLKREFKRHLRIRLGDDGANWLPGSAWSIGHTPLYWSLKTTIAAGSGFDITAPQEVIHSSILDIPIPPEERDEVLPYILHLYGVDGEASPLARMDAKTVKENLWVAVRRLYAHWAEKKPTILVFEDVQWADAGTIDFINYLAEFMADFPVLIVLIHRPDFTPDFAKNPRASFKQIRLNALPPKAERELLETYIHSGPKEQLLVRKLLKRTEGNPLFLEEMVHLMLEQGRLEEREGKLHLTQDVERMPLPTRLSEVLSERFDTLSKRDKSVAYCAAAIGHAFPYRLL